MNLPKVKMLQVSKCLIGLAVMMLQSCDVADNRRDMLCGNWESVEGKPDVLIYKEGEAYKAVSYTHLDVYKRQIWNSTRRESTNCTRNNVKI